MAVAGKPRGEYAKTAERREEILRASGWGEEVRRCVQSVLTVDVEPIAAGRPREAR